MRLRHGARRPSAILESRNGQRQPISGRVARQRHLPYYQTQAQGSEAAAVEVEGYGSRRAQVVKSQLFGSPLTRSVCTRRRRARRHAPSKSFLRIARELARVGGTLLSERVGFIGGLLGGYELQKV